MRHKQRPIKSSRHKSVTMLNESPHTSFVHNNVRHMDNVMRLAFLENNDITPETWKDVDFNSLSTASILKRNIQQQLQQEQRAKEQEQQAKQQQHLFIQQQLLEQAKIQQRLQQQLRIQDYKNRSRRVAQAYQLRCQERQLYYDQGDVSQRDDPMLDYGAGHNIDADEDGDAGGQLDLSLLARAPNARKHQSVQYQAMRRSSNARAGSRNYELSDSHIFSTELPEYASTPSPPPAPSPPIVAQQPPSSSSSSRNRSVSSAPMAADRATIARASSPNRRMILSSPLGNPISVSIKHASQQDVQRQVVSLNGDQARKQNGEYPCDEPDCGKSFPSLRKLRHHKVVHSDDFPFHCQFKGCEKKFKRKFGIDLHSTTHFDLDPEMYRKTSNDSSLPFFGRRMQYSMCKPCGQRFKTVLEYQQHMLNHGKEPFKCPVKGCGQTFSIWKSFQKHRASHYFNYYCQMDPHCDHFTSNLQLLKLHIYCCHFQRKLPENATLSSRDSALERERPPQDGPVPLDGSMDVDEEDEDEEIDGGEVGHEKAVKNEKEEEEELGEEEDFQHQQQTREGTSQGMHPEEADDSIENSQKPNAETSRRDPRLRRNPPRSSTFGHQDYASISNGSSFAKITGEMSSPSSKRARTSAGSVATRSPEKNSSPKTPPKVVPGRSCGTSVTPKKEDSKLPLKVLPKRSAQRMPMSLIAAADDESTEDDNGSEAGSSRNHSRNTNSGAEGDNYEGGFRCHLCDYKFSVRFQLTKHLSTHLELRPDMYSATADAKVIQISERRRREFYCEKCHVKFEHMLDLDTHMRKHGQRPYVCSFCQVPSTFRLAKQYLSHLYEHRFNYRCMMSPDCNFTINRKDALKLHIYRMHIGPRVFLS